MEPFPHNKAEGAKKVIVAASSPSNNVLRARSSKVSSSPRHIKPRTSKTYSGTRNVNGNLMNMSWPSLGHQMSPGKSSPEKTPLGLYSHGSSFGNSHSGLQLDSNTFLSDSSIARFNATLFSSPGNRHSQDVEEAMDIDHQDVSDEAACASGTISDVTGLSEENGSATDQLSGMDDKNFTKEYPPAGKTNCDTASTKPMEAKQEQRVPAPNPKKRVTASSVVQESALSSLPNKKRAIYIVLHVSTIQIGDLVGKASAPVKIYAEKIFIEMEANEGKGCKSISHHFRIPCKDLAECKVNFDGLPFLFVVKPTPAGASTIQEKCKEKGKFLDPESQDIKKRYIVLVMNYKVMPRDIKTDLLELFQHRFADQLTWSELSSKQAQELLDRKEEACPSPRASGTQSPKPASPVSMEHRKILTPKGKNARKKLFTEGPKSPSSKESAASSSAATEKELPECAEGKSKEPNDTTNGMILTRSRRRKASAVTNVGAGKPVPTSSEPVKPDILLHHKEMESHITLLDQHSKEQREHLQRHQRLLDLERGKLREVEEENERQLGRMRHLEISFSADKERLLETIRVLESALSEKDQVLRQQTVNLTLMNSELEQERASLRQLQNELEQEREANSLLPKVQSDLVRTRRALDEEKVVRNMREQQLREKETNFHGLQATLGEEQQTRLRLEEELRQARSACTQLERTLENERLSNQSNRQDVQTKEDTIREQMRLLQQEREIKTGLEDRVRNLQIQVEEERNSRITAERDVAEQRNTLQQDRENLERERERYEQRIQDGERTVNESELRLRELQSAVSAAQDALAEYRRLEPRDWIIRREEVILSQKTLGVGAWGKVYEGPFRSCQVAVKQIHDLILSPHNRRLFEREMSIASRCRHPHLLQFIGATNDDGSPLFVTELLDTDLRNVLTLRALHHEEIVCIALDVAKGLNYLHLNKPFPIIHRDISSSNVLLWRRDDSWRAKLSDYGAANFMRQYMTSNPGARIYAAPEALTSQQSPKADVYSFGLLLCEMCIRELPVPQQIQEQIGLVTNGVLRELIMRCVMRAPEARPTISDVIAVLTHQAEALRAQGLATLNGRTVTL